MKTSAALLVICLNIGTDPPDVIKPNPCARKECWIEPILPKQKGLEIIGNALQSQYERLHSKVKYKQCLDPTVDDLRRICVNLRKGVKNERLLFHYNGHGVPRPTKNGEIWLFGRHYTHYLPVSIHEVHSWLSYPTVYLFDCSAAGVLISQLLDNEDQDYMNNNNINENSLIYSSSKSSQIETIISKSMNAEGHCIILAACKADEVLPMNPLYPADIFTCSLTTPIPIALRHLIIQNPFSLSEINLDLAENFPGKENDRKTPRGELNWIFTAITDTIAFSVLPPLTFQKIFRQDMMSWPIIPDTSHHNLWQTWDLTAESCLLHVVGLLRGLPMIDPKNNIPFLRNQDVISPSVILNDYSNTNIPAANLPFFTEQLTAFEIWLNFGNTEDEIPIQLPILLQVLLSQTHRLRALVLLKRYLSLGPTAINSTLVVEDFVWAKYLCITEAGHTQLYPLLQHVDPIIRAAATLTLGENFGHPSGRSNSDISVGSVDSLVDPRELREAELQLAITLLDCCIDGNILLIKLNIQIDLPNTSFDNLKQSTSNNKNNSNRKLNEELENTKIYPWNLLPHQTQVLVDEVIIYLESQGIGSTPPITPEINENNNQNNISIRRPSSISPNATLPVAGMMAAAYVRFWLAIYEVRGKDPNISIAKAANLLCLRIHDQISIDDKRNKTYNESFNELVTSITSTAINEVSSNELNIITDNQVAIGQYQPLSPVGLTSKLRDNQKRSNNKFVKPIPFENIVNDDSRNNSTSSELSKSLLFGISNQSGSFLLNNARSTSIDSSIINDHRSYEENADNPFDMPVSSYYYWTKKMLFKTNKADEFSNDPFSCEGNNRLYREMKYSEACSIVNKIVEIYKVLDDSTDYYIRDRKTKEENQMARSAVIAAMPLNLVKFDQKLIINIENAKMTSSILFHPFHDIIATTDGRNVKMWSIATGNMLLDVLNSHNHLGSDNGNVTVWKDISESIESINNVSISNESNSSYDKHSLLYSSSSNNKLSVASSFIALPDIADTNRGSGLISSWIQESGTLVAAGNSPTIRVWDLKYEKCIRVFTTGLDTCTTTIASKSVSSSFFTRGAMDLTPSQMSSNSHANEYSHTPTWTFAGFADGTVSIFDEKLSSLSGKAQSVRAESSGWIIAAYTRHDLPQVITASVKGTVKFWDIRKMGVYKTLEVFKQPLTALAVHKCVPIIATGSQSQIIKIFTMGGDQLDRDIKYHDGFLGQRIGPVSCLAFHPYKMLLASGATDNIVSIYSPTSSKYNEAEKFGKEAFEDLAQVSEYFPDVYDDVSGSKVIPREVLEFALDATNAASSKLSKMIELFPTEVLTKVAEDLNNEFSSN
eukprot:gene18908-24711_t